MKQIKKTFDRDGFVVLPAHLSTEDLAASISELDMEFPTAEEFHDNVDPDRNRRFRDDFGGITNFPFSSIELSLLSVHPLVIALAQTLLESTGLRVYSIEAWAKDTGAADYDQSFHRDYLNHTLLVPAPDRPARQVEMFVYLTDVPVELGPPNYVSQRHTKGMPALPNWHPRSDGVKDPDHPSWVSSSGRPDLYDHEVSGAGPAGTVVAYRIETFHRGTQLTKPRGARYTLHVSFRVDTDDWIGRRCWVDSATNPHWHAFVIRASPRQLEMFGFPPAGHPYWTSETLAGIAQRYPGLDVSHWS